MASKSKPTPPADRIRFPFPDTIPIAHRGSHGRRRPENSLEAVRHALRLGAPAVELDVRHVAGAGFLVGHDWPQRSEPALAQFLQELAEAPDALLVLDWKGGGHETELAALLAEGRLTSRTIVTTSDGAALASFAAAAAPPTLGLTLPRERAETDFDAVRLAREAGAAAVSVDAASATPERIGAIRAAGLGLFLWTARDRRSYMRLLRFRPDGIMTDAVETVLRPGLSRLLQ